jgi:class 3 adenylate cyclase
MAIMAADVAGYSRLMHDDEEGTPARLTALVAETVEPGGTRGPRGQAYWGWVFG